MPSSSGPSSNIHIRRTARTMDIGCDDWKSLLYLDRTLSRGYFQSQPWRIRLLIRDSSHTASTADLLACNDENNGIVVEREKLAHQH